MKRFMAVMILVVLFVAMLAACNESPSPPRIEFVHSGYRYDYKSRYFAVRDGFILSEGNPYDIVETDAGYDMVLHFVPEEQSE